MPLTRETARLTMRPARPADLADLVSLHEDAAVEDVFGTTSKGEVIEWIEASMREWSERGLGRLLIFDRESGSFLGRSGLRWWAEFEEVEVGWSLRAEARGKGIATEAARACVDWGFRDFAMPYITAMIVPRNAASLAVATRLGMKRLRRDVLLGEAVEVYALQRDRPTSTPLEHR